MQVHPGVSEFTYCTDSCITRKLVLMTDHMHDDSPFHMGDRIKKAGELAGFDSVLALAEATGLSRNSLGQYEATGVVPRRSTRITIALATGVRLAWLETGKGPVFNDEARSLPHLDSNQEPTGFMPETWLRYELELAAVAS